MNKFQIEIIVCLDDLDELNHVNNVRYFDFLQKVAIAHWMGNVPAEISDSLRWVVKKHQIEYHKASFLNDCLTVNTWVSKVEGIMSIRHYEIHRGTELIVSAETLWISIDPITFKPKRLPKNLGKDYFGLE